MVRRYKCLLFSSCVLVLMLLVILQYRGHNFAVIQESLSHFHLQDQPGNVSAPNNPVTPLPPLYFMATPSYNPVPSNSDLEKMSHIEIQAFYHSYVNSPQVACSRVERMGKLTDGGWEICDDPLYRPLKGDCLVYSYGISFDFSYDDDMAVYGCEVHAFDPSMNTAPYLRGERVFFHPSGIGAKDGTIVSPPKYETWQIHTMSSHRKMLQHTPEQRRLDIVKMDVEGAELDSLMAALDDGSLFDVRQLSFETHVAWGRGDPTKEQYISFLALMRKVYEKGFRIYLTHRNYVYSAFDSLLVKGKKRAYCHEIHTVNINYKNTINADGSIVGDNVVGNDKRQERHQQQMQILSREQTWYSNRGKAQPVAVPNAAPQLPVQPQSAQAQPPVQGQPPPVQG